MNANVLCRGIPAILTLAGAAVGLLTSARQALAGEISGIGWPVTAVFVLLYAIGLVAGAMLLRDSGGARALALPYWIAQIPVLSSGLLSYYFGAGINVYVTVGAAGQVAMNWFIGAHFGVSVGTVVAGAIGLNLGAVIVVALLLIPDRAERRAGDG